MQGLGRDRRRSHLARGPDSPGAARAGKDDSRTPSIGAVIRLFIAAGESTRLSRCSADLVNRHSVPPGAGKPAPKAQPMLSGSELWLLRLMADRGLALLDAGTLLIVIEERGELRMAASSGAGIPGVRILSVEGSALGALYRAGQPVALDRPRGQEALWLHELGIEARGVLVEPLSMEGHG